MTQDAFSPRRGTGCSARRPHALLGVLLGTLLAAPTLHAGPRSDDDDAEPSPADPELRRTEAIELIRTGDYERARSLIGELLLDDYLDRARGLLHERAPEDALIYVDRVLTLSPRHPEGRRLKASGSLALAEKGIAEGATEAFIVGALQDAFDFHVMCAPDDPAAAFGASRAAYLLGDTAGAVRWARTGRRSLEAGTVHGPDVWPDPYRTIAESLFSAYVRAKRDLEDERAESTAEPDTARVDALFVEVEDALGDLLGRAADTAWPWRALCDLYEWQGHYELARARAHGAIDRFPTDESLTVRLDRITRRAAGDEAVIETFADLVARYPGVALAHWYLARQRFDLAVERIDRGEGPGDLDVAALTAAEADFKRCRELEPLYTQACKTYEAVCRGARGWCAYYEGDLETAEAEFLGMNDVFPGGIQWSVEGLPGDGAVGLAFVGDRYHERGEAYPAGEAFVKAGEFRPTEASWANNAGFLLRDAAVEKEADARRLCRAAHGQISDARMLAELRDLAAIGRSSSGGAAERARFAEVATALAGEARAIMERSWAAYERAVRHSPDDMRTINDAALVLVYYLHHDLDRAEELLLRCIELGAEQVAALESRLAAADVGEEERGELENELLELEEAWGDAHQNMGVLEWVHRKDADAAIAYLERAVEIGPDPRVMLTNNLMPLIRGEREPGADEYFDLLRWASPCRYP